MKITSNFYEKLYHKISSIAPHDLFFQVHKAIDYIENNEKYRLGFDYWHKYDKENDVTFVNLGGAWLAYMKLFPRKQTLAIRMEKVTKDIDYKREVSKFLNFLYNTSTGETLLVNKEILSYFDNDDKNIKFLKFYELFADYIGYIAPHIKKLKTLNLKTRNYKYNWKNLDIIEIYEEIKDNLYHFSKKLKHWDTIWKEKIREKEENKPKIIEIPYRDHYIATIDIKNNKLLEVYTELGKEFTFDKLADEGYWDEFVELDDNLIKFGNLEIYMGDAIKSGLSDTEKRIWMDDYTETIYEDLRHDILREDEEIMQQIENEKEKMEEKDYAPKSNFD